MLEMIKTFFIGIFVGIANVIPGVSGGTLIVVFNIYEKFVNAITFNVKKLLQNWKFVVPVLLGMLSGILLFSKLVTILYRNCPDQTNFFFTGLLIGSIPLLAKYSFNKKNREDNKSDFTKNAVIILCALTGIILIILFSILQTRYGTVEKTISTLPEWTLPLAIKIFIGGILGAVAMIIPGISGSLIMLILGIYPIIITSIPAMFVKKTALQALFLLLPNGAGVLIGLLAGAKLISLLLKKVPNQTYTVILGLIIGSIYTMWPRVNDFTAIKIVSYVLCLIFGTALSYLSTKFSGEETQA